MTLPDNAHYITYDANLRQFVKHNVIGIADDGLLITEVTQYVDAATGTIEVPATPAEQEISDIGDDLLTTVVLPVQGDVSLP